VDSTICSSPLHESRAHDYKPAHAPDGSVAMEILLKLFNGADSKTNIKVPGSSLIVRESTAAPRSSH